MLIKKKNRTVCSLSMKKPQEEERPKQNLILCTSSDLLIVIVC